MTSQMSDVSRRRAQAVIATVLVIGLPVAGVVPDSIRLRWILTAVIVVGFLLLAARIHTGTVLGLFVDSRNKTSSSRLQLIGWTILILSAYSTAVLWNVTAHATDPLAVGIPGEIWALLGISATSFVGSPLLRQRNVGALPSNLGVREARMSDVLMDEGSESPTSLDIGKVQMLLFTLILLVAYAAGLYELFVTRAAAGAPIVEFPAVSQGMLVLLGLSHSGYLVNKAVPQAPRNPAPPARG